MKTNTVPVIAVLVGMLTTSVGIAANDQSAQTRLRAVQREQVEVHPDTAQLPNPDAASLPGGSGNGLTIMLVVVSGDTVRVMKILAAPDSARISPLMLAKGRPSWCTLFPNWPRCNI
jgi:hypothetical protein